jgi:hypothetical protein
LDKACLSGLEIAVRGFGGVTGGSDFGLAALALRYVAVNQDKPAIRHGIAPNLDHSTIGPCSFLSELLIHVFETAAEFGLNIHGAKLTSFSE